MNKTLPVEKPYPVGRVEVPVPFPEVRQGGQVKGFNLDNARSNLAAKEIDKPNYALRRIGAVVVAGLAVFGAIKVGEKIADRVQSPDIPALDTPYTIRPGDTADAIARHSMPNEEYRGLMDELTDEASHLKENPGFNVGNTINVPHQYTEYLDAQEQHSAK